MVSENIKAFLDFVDESRKVYAFALDNMHREEKSFRTFFMR